MHATVGGRLQVVAATPRLSNGDRAYLLLLVAAAAAVHVWLFGHTFVTARDGLGFARYAANLKSPNAGTPPGGPRRSLVDVVKTAQHPPGYPAAVLAASFAITPFTDAPPPEQMLRACQLASLVAGILLAFPTYYLGRTLFGPAAGFAGALLFQILPVPSHVTSDGLTEALYLLCVATAAGLGLVAVRGRNPGLFVLCGMAVGASYLVRPEGMMTALAVGGVVFLLGVAKRWPRGEAVGRLAALGVGVMLVAGPYMAVIGGVTNKSTATEILNRMIPGNPRAEVWKGDKAALPAAGGTLFAEWYDPAIHGEKVPWAMKAVVKEVWKSFHYAPCVLALVGVFLARKRFVTEPETAVLPALAVINLGVILVLGLKIGYVSERHTMLVVLIGCLFAGAALEPIGKFLAGFVRVNSPRLAAAGLFVVVAASALPSAVKPLHENRLGHYFAGKFLEGKVGPADAVIDPFCWAEWYAGRTLYDIPPDPASPAARWAIVEKAGNTHSRLPRLEAATNVVTDTVNKAELVYHWPADVPAAEGKVFVYRQTVGGK